MTGSEPTSVPNNIADKFVLLFSADWFRPYWHLTGFKPEPGSDDLFQQEMRSQVKALMSDADQYWHVPFTEQRIQETRSGFLASLRRHAVPDSDLRLIEGDLHSKAPADVVTDISMAHWGDYDALLEKLRRVDLQATDWDRYLASLTPDLPTLAQDFAFGLLRFY